MDTTYFPVIVASKLLNARSLPSTRFILCICIIPRPWMRRHIDLLRLSVGYVRVYLRGRGAGMPHQFLYHSQVSATLQHVRGIRVPQRVRMHAGGKSRFDTVTSHLLLYAALTQSPTESV